jgi:pyrroloquinoline quinone biosynthesis protein B
MSVWAMLLGTVQDGGLPHAGCVCGRCVAARQPDFPPHYVTSMGVVDERQEPPAVYVLDASPDIKHQLAMLAPWLGAHPTRANRLRQPTAIFLTHAHMGHVAGLAQLGKEAMSVQDLAVYAPPLLVEMLAENRLWRPLIAQLDLRPLFAHQPIPLGEGLTLTPRPVPHRDEWGTGTFGFELRGRHGSLLYLPDIDQWGQWPEAAEVLGGVDVAVVDGTFYSGAELGRQAAVPHSLIPETLALWRNLPSQLVLTHFNHTNPVLDPASEERALVTASGAVVGEAGLRWPL